MALTKARLLKHAFPVHGLTSDMLNHFVLIEFYSVDILVVCFRIGTRFLREFLQRDASMRALSEQCMPRRTTGSNWRLF